jgi:hypothetical protein
MLLVATSQLLFFRWKGWFGSITTRSSNYSNGNHRRPPAS